jgi:hypothetical protein
VDRISEVLLPHDGAHCYRSALQRELTAVPRHAYWCLRLANLQEKSGSLELVLYRIFEFGEAQLGSSAVRSAINNIRGNGKRTDDVDQLRAASHSLDRGGA